MRDEALKSGINALVGFVRFRNPHSAGVVIVQCFMLLSALLVIVGLIYVCILVIAIGIHHMFFDRNANFVPSYVKKSMQFDSDSESDNEKNLGSKSGHKRLTFGNDKAAGAIIEISDEDSADGDNKGGNKKSKAEFARSNTIRKAAALDKFMRKDIDVKQK